MIVPQLEPLPSISNVKLGHTIGKGAFAIVKQASIVGASSTLPPIVAIKYVHRASCHRQGISDERIGLELRAHLECSGHPNVIHLFSYGTNNIWIYHVLELAKGGDLFDKIEPDIGIDDMLANFYFNQLINAVDFIHRKGVAHRDIKPENILLDQDGNLKLADFGLSTVYRKKSSPARMSTEKCGSAPYMAPEVISDDQYDPVLCDIWGCGIVLYVLLTGQIPWEAPIYGESPDYTSYVDKKEMEPWSSFGDLVKSLLKATICPSTARRYSIEQIRLHPWFNYDNEFMTADSMSKDSSQIADALYSQLDVDLESASLGVANFISASQPVNTGAALRSFSPLMSQQVSHRPQADKILEIVSKDPSLLQFKGRQFRMSQLTATQQNMAKFSKLNVARMTRFFSVVPVESLVVMIRDALHRLGVSTNRLDEAIGDDLGENISIHVTTEAPKSKLPLKGVISIDKCDSDVDLWKVEFQKLRGDPLDWRRFFKNITIICRDAVYID